MTYKEEQGAIPASADPRADLLPILQSGDQAAIRAFMDLVPQGEVGRLLTRLDDDSRTAMLAALDPERAAELLQNLADIHAADVLTDLEPHETARIVDEMESHHRADVMAEMPDHYAERVLQAMDADEAEDARQLMEYDEDCAGGLMVTEFLQYPLNMRVAEMVADLRRHAENFYETSLHYAYVESEQGRLIGVVRMRDLLLAEPDTPLSKIMIGNPIYVFAKARIEELDDHFERYPFWSLPVVDDDGKMQGVVRRADIEEALSEFHERNLLSFGGIIGGEEIRSLPLVSRVSRRMAWLSINVLLSLIAASVILIFEGTIAQLFAVVFFMPVICNMSGCSGNQAVAVSIRELALGLIQPEDFVTVWKQELAVGAINGLVIGTLIGAAATLLSALVWHTPPLLGLVIGGAFFVNSMVSVSLGGLIPLGLKHFRLDAALGAPPILTTLSDMCGLFIVLSLSYAALSAGLL